jgi:outer membrane protein TolC
MRHSPFLFIALAATILPLSSRGENIDLPTVLKLAGAQNIEVQIAEAKLKEAQALDNGSVWQLFPTLSPGVSYRNHSGRAQAFDGSVSDVEKQSVAAGGTVQLQLELGEAIYRRLVAKQVAVAAVHQLEAQRQQTLLQAAQAYFDLSRAHQSIALLEASAKTAHDFHAQILNGVKAGLAFKGDEYRAFAQLNRAEVKLQQARDTAQAAATNLAQILRLKITDALTPADLQPLPLAFDEKKEALDALVQRSIQKRPEIAENEALVEATEAQLKGVTYGPLFPTLGAQYYAGGLGGSTSSSRSDYASSSDTVVTLSWKIGAGGLFDSSRKNAAEALHNQVELKASRTRESITRQVVDAYANVGYLSSQLELLKQGVQASEAGLKLALARKEFAVGVVLEALQSQQDLIQAQLDYLQAVAELNKAQYRLKVAVGE